MQVPVENLYYLLCYAHNCFSAMNLAEASAYQADRPVDLFADVLSKGMTRILKRGLDRGYLEFEEETRSPRGKFLVARTVTRFLEQRGAAACLVSELSVDVLHNQILKATLRRLARVDELDHRIRSKVRHRLLELRAISDIELSSHAFRRVQLHGNNAEYRFLIRICEIVHRSLLVDPASGAIRFQDFRGSEQAMGNLFEAFVRNFWKREQSYFKVSAPHIPWAIEGEGGSSLDWIPNMETDITLRAPGQHIVVETKCTGKPLAGKHAGHLKLRSAHLYQLQSYLLNLRAKGADPIGLLLYAKAGQEMRFDYVLQGVPLRVRSLDLNQPWSGIRGDLLGLGADLAS